MSRHAAPPERQPSVGEEIASSVSHGIGLLAAIAAAPVLVVVAVRRGSTAGVVGASVFATTIVILYLTSTLYHALPVSKAKRVFRILDHGAIFLLIAGTYTPFTLGVLRGAWGWTLFGLIWGLAVAGIVLVWGLFWLFAGGLAYTLGVAFYAATRLPYGHLVWHLFVIAGTTCHYVAVLNYAA